MNIWTQTSQQEPTQNDADMFNNIIAFDAEHDQVILINIFEFEKRKGLTYWRETGIKPQPNLDILFAKHTSNQSLIAKEKIKIILKDNFSDLFSCTRTWNAWSYETMKIDDFISLSEDEDLLEEIATSMLNAKNNSDIEDVFSGYEFHYNSDIDNNFYHDAFYQDWFDFYELETIFNEILSKLKENIDERTVAL